MTDNELAYLESIHLFVEILDHFFSNVCELDLVFNFHKVCHSFCIVDASEFEILTPVNHFETQFCMHSVIL